ncbi:MAG: PCMD domain-containing protein [Muribaculaceae bacterium]|nr:PCMD domain-containing protein [Muribaculaceae bacterium]
MNNIKKNIFYGVFTFMSALTLVSCTDESPFNTEGEGDSSVSFTVSVNETVTRGVSDTENASLLKNVVLQISDERGMLYNWKGYDNIPSGSIAFKYGQYVASASSGDSVPASFDKRLFKGHTEFSVSQNQIATQVTVICRIANVVVGVDASEIEDKFKNDLNIEFSTTDGELVFDKNNLDASGYFMRSYDKETGKYDDVINYTVSGKDKDGNLFTKTGKITGVQPAHGYTLNILSYEKDETSGGLSLRLQIQEYSLVSDTVVLEGHPEFKWEESSILKNGQILGTDETFTDQTLVIGAYSELKSLILSSNDENIIAAFNHNLPIDLTLAPYTVKRELNELGVEYEKSYVNSAESTYIKYSLTLKENWLKALPVSPDEYKISLTAIDNREYVNTANIRIANSNSAIAPPFEIIDDYWKKDYLAIRAHSAQVKINMMEGANDVTNPMLQYRKVGEEDWQSVNLTDLSVGEKIVTIKNLESDVYPNPGVAYECRLVGGDMVEGDYQYRTKELKTFTTETKFMLPNASLENWCMIDNKYYLPNAAGDPEFWGNGNKGSTAVGASANLTTQCTTIYHTGSSCAQLVSKFVGMLGMGKHGAGSLIIGEFVDRDGLMDGMIDLGREYNNSHPTAMKLWIKYAPGIADKGASNNYIKKGDYDQGQIYIALASSIHRANTKYPETLVTQESLPSAFVAYGQRTFTVNDEDFIDNVFQDDQGQLKEVVIPFEYLDKAHSTEAKYLVMVCAASKYGDYFSGGEGSTMWVDDVELIYD